MREKKENGYELLKGSHFKLDNPWGKPVIGWKKIPKGLGGYYNPRGFANLPGVHWQRGEDGERKYLYEQRVLLVENPGAVVIVMDEVGRIGLVQVHRTVADRDEEMVMDPDGYIGAIARDNRWEEVAGSLGKTMWEAPRGIAPIGDNTNGIEAGIRRIAAIEAEEEAGFSIADVEVVGMVNPNTTFFAHAQYVVCAKLVAQGATRPENLEVLGNVHFFSTNEIRRLNREGQFVDGLALAAMALAGISLA